MSRFVEKLMKLPKDFKPAGPDRKRAGDYLSRKRSPALLIEDPELWFILDDKQPDGSLLYVFQRSFIRRV